MFMSITEILDELPKLNIDERRLLSDRLHALEGDEIEETPEMLAFIDEGIRSAEQGGDISLEEARQRVSQWASK